MKMNRKYWKGDFGRFKDQDHLDAYLHCLHTSQVGDLIEVGCFYLTSSGILIHSYLAADTDVRVYDGPVIVKTFPISHKQEEISILTPTHTPKRVSYPCVHSDHIKDMIAYDASGYKAPYIPLYEDIFWATRIIKKLIP